MLALWITLAWVFYLLVDRFLRSLKVNNFADKYVFITGCDTGFGRLLAMRLYQLDFHVFAGCLTKDGSQSLSQSCSSRLETVPLDVSKTESINEAVKFVKERIPPEKGLWALVNNAGVPGACTPCEMSTRDDFIAIFDVNFFGVVELTRLCLPLIRKARGRIVNMASAAARLAFIAAPYTCSKCAVEAYSDIVRREMSKYGVKVSILEPGAFKTAVMDVDIMVAKVEKAWEKSSQDVKDFYGLVDRYREKFFFVDRVPSDLSVVVDAYIHAITAKFPRTRYPLGKDCKFFYMPLSYLPVWLSDWIIGRIF